MSVVERPLRVVLFGDGESPHLLKWARALAPRVELFVASSRGLTPALAELVAPERTLLLGHATKFEGGNVALLKTLPTLARWLRLTRARGGNGRCQRINHRIFDTGIIAAALLRCRS